MLRSSRRPERLAAVGLLAAATAIAALACERPPAPRGVVLVVLDTLRADGLSAYGNPRPVSPRLDQLAQEGVLFEQAISNACWTLPGFVGLLSGSYPSERVFQGRLGRSLVEEFARAGYATAAFTEGGYVSAHFGMDRGFARFSAVEGDVHLQGPLLPDAAAADGGIESTFANARAWLRDHADRPFFLLVHTYEVHMPYLRRELADGLPRGALPEVYDFDAIGRVARDEIAVGATEQAYVRALYDGGVAVADREVGGLLDTLAELGIADRTVVAVTADHGEQLGERSPKGLGTHGNALYDTLLHVPLILYDPTRRFPVRRIAEQVRLVDVMPTLLALAGIPPPTDVDGRSLVPLLEGEERTPRPAYAELTRGATRAVRQVAWRDGAFKLIVNVPPLAHDAPPAELYDLASDPGERENLATVDPERKRALAAQLRTQREAIAAGGIASYDTRSVPEALQDRLRALGYVQ